MMVFDIKRGACCDIFLLKMHDKQVPLCYNYIFRKYFLRSDYIAKYYDIYYCLWCGSKLPSNLEDKYHDILRKDYGINDPENLILGEKIPEEFKSDEWWKKRSL